MPDIWLDVDTALTEVPVNKLPLIGSSDFITIDETIAYDEAGMDLNWNFMTPAGAFTQTNVVPTTAGTHDWTHQGNGMYSLEIPASAGTINNDTEGVGWFTGFATGGLTTRPWRMAMKPYLTTVAARKTRFWTICRGTTWDKPGI